jgi:hypothetical protein
MKQKQYAPMSIADSPIYAVERGLHGRRAGQQDRRVRGRAARALQANTQGALMNDQRASRRLERRDRGRLQEGHREFKATGSW